MVGVNEFIQSLQIGKVQTHKNLDIYSLVSPLTRNLNVQSLNEALEAGTAKITEMDGGAEVPHLKFTNTGNQSILVIEGVIIQGNLQNRTVRRSFLLRAGHEEMADVYCVEQGRWNSGGRTGHASKFHLYSELRKMNSRKGSNQSHTWNSIGNKSARMHTVSGSGAVDEIYQQHEERIDAYKHSFTCKADYVGMIASVNEHIVGLEVLGINGLFQKQFPSLISSYVMDAIDEGYCEELSKRKKLTVDEFLRCILSAKKETVDSISRGKNIRIESERVSGTALLDEDALVHMAVFA